MITATALIIVALAAALMSLSVVISIPQAHAVSVCKPAHEPGGPPLQVPPCAHGGPKQR
jgi:hypothetical protein